MIIADRSEYRSNSLTKRWFPEEDNELTLSNTIEEMSGADLIITSHARPLLDTTDIGAFKLQVGLGARLVQVKFGLDLLNSVADGRLYHSINRMKYLGAINPQCILLFIGTYTQNERGTLFVNGRQTHGNHSLSALYGIINTWHDHGGIFHQIPSGEFLPNWLLAMNKALEKPADKELYPIQSRMTEAMFSPNKLTSYANVLRSETVVTDLRILLNAIPGLGPVKCQQFYQDIEENHGEVNIDTISAYFKSDEALAITGVGKKTITSIREFLKNIKERVMVKQKPSMLPQVFHDQLLQISGLAGTGKTTMAITFDFPDQIAVADMELGKGRSITDQYEGKIAYSSIYDPSAPHKTVDNLVTFLESISPGSRSTLVLDNFVDFEKTILAWVYENASVMAAKYKSLSAKGILDNSYGQPYSAMDFKAKEIFHLIATRGFKCVIVTSHITPVFGKPGKFEVKGRAFWQNYSVLSLILFKSPDGTNRDAFIYKESIASHKSVDSSKLSDSQIEAMMRGEEPSVSIGRVFPPRIPNCDAQKIRYYISHPVGDDLKPDEYPREEELNGFSPLMTNAEVEAMNLLIQAQAAEQERLEAQMEEEREARFEVMIKDIKVLHKKTPALPKLADELRKKYAEFSDDINVALITKHIK